MPVLEHEKHESFALGLAKGQKQKEAYVNAGYAANDSAASRLAQSPVIKERVEELKNEIFQRMNAVANSPNEETVGSLQEMGLTIEWCAAQFKEIYQNALSDGQYAPANAAVKNIQSLIEVRSAGVQEDDKAPEPLIKISEVSGMLDSLKGVIEAAKGPEEIQDSAVDAVDVTPADTKLSPTTLLENIEEIEDDYTP